jgi:hypothetical protein
VAAAVGEHLLAALHSESVKALAAQFQQLFAFGVAQLLAAHQVVGASLVAGDAVEGEPCPLGAAVPAGHVLRHYHPHACSVRMPS